MNNDTSLLGATGTLFAKKVVSLVLLVSLIGTPLVPVFAQVAEDPGVGADTQPVVESTNTAPETFSEGDVLSESAGPEVQVPTDEVPEISVGAVLTPEEEMSAMSTESTLSNSQREVFQTARNRVSTEIDETTGALVY